MIITIRRVKTSSPHIITFFCVVTAFKIYSLGLPSQSNVTTVLHLPVQGMGFDPSSGSKDLTCLSAKKNPKHKMEVIL